MVPHEVSDSILTNGDRYLILFFISPAATGVYAVATGLVRFIPKIASIFNSTLYPNIASAWDAGEQDRLSSFYFEFIRGYGIIMIPAAAGVAILALPLLELISTPSIAQQAVGIVPLLLIGLLFRGVERPLSYILPAANETQKVAYTTGLAVGTNVVLNLILIPLYGLPGAAVATTMSYGVKAGSVYWFSRKHLVLKLPVGDLFRICLATGAMSGLLVVLPLGENPLSIVVYPLVGMSIYFVAIWALNVVNYDDFKTIKDVLQS
jgi:O-antigen/teichoic acid export membrane protein